ncbi:MAG: 8-oxo-dGTP diphosphatase MutT [Culicoidibacterales bacterium]
MEKRKIIVVAAIIRNQDEQIFVAKRNAKKNFGMMWEFPGGKVEHGESHCQALARELSEELGIQATVQPTCYAITQHEHERAEIELHFYQVHQFSGQIVLHEHEDGKWLKHSEFDSVEFVPADIEVVRQLQREGQ